MSKCNICGEEVDFQDGGIALMMALVNGHTTNLVNVSICGWCYKEYGIDDAIKMLNKSACLHIKFPEDDNEG